MSNRNTVGEQFVWRARKGAPHQHLNSPPKLPFGPGFTLLLRSANRHVPILFTTPQYRGCGVSAAIPHAVHHAPFTMNNTWHKKQKNVPRLKGCRGRRAWCACLRRTEAKRTP